MFKEAADYDDEDAKLAYALNLLNQATYADYPYICKFILFLFYFIKNNKLKFINLPFKRLS